MARVLLFCFAFCGLLGNTAGADPSSTCTGGPTGGHAMVQIATAKKTGVKEVENKTGGQDSRSLLSGRTDRSASVTKTKLEDALEAVGYSTGNAKSYASDLSGELTYDVEVAMFLGQAFHESGGLTYTKETSPGNGDYDWGSCSGCAGTASCDWKDDTNGKSWRGSGCGSCCSIHYYGRGFLQLTWKKNYEDYGHGSDPDHAKNNPMDSAVWFWKNRVLPCSGCWDGGTVDYWPTLKTNSISKAEMGQATMAINPTLECPKSGKSIDCTHKCRAHHRWEEFKKIAAKWGLGTPSEDDACYSASDLSSCTC